jgi:hypothetical protein
MILLTEKSSVGKPGGRWGMLLEGIGRFVSDMELEGVSKEKRSLEEGDRGGQGPKTKNKKKKKKKNFR